MNKKKSSIIWSPTKEKFQEIINNSSTFSDILNYFGFNGHRGNHRTLKTRIKEENISLEKFIVNNKKYKENLIVNSKISDSEVFKENSNYSNSSLKRRILQNNAIKYECTKCNNNGEWNGEKLILQLDHINGIHNDHRLENLRFLCPNCHSQTKTYAGKQAKKKYLCKICNEEINNRNCEYCNSCRKEAKEKTCYKIKFDPTKEELIEKLKELKFNMTKVGIYYSVSDNAIRKRCIKLNIDWKKLKKAGQGNRTPFSSLEG